jgi:hypothetical protein
VKILEICILHCSNVICMSSDSQTWSWSRYSGKCFRQENLPFGLIYKKRKGFPLLAMRTHRVSKCITLLFLILGVRWTWEVDFRPHLSLGKEHRLPWNRMLCGPQSRSARLEKKISSLYRDSNPKPSTPQPCRYTDRSFSLIWTFQHMRIRKIAAVILS